MMESGTLPGFSRRWRCFSALDREDARSRSLRLDRDECPLTRLPLEAPDGADDSRGVGRGQRIDDPELHYAGYRSAARCKDGAEIEVMGEDDVPVLPRPPQDYEIAGVVLANVAPVNRLEAGLP